MTRVFEQRDGKPFAIEGGPVNLGIAVDVERKDGSRSLMVPAIKGADGLDFAAFHSCYEELITKTRENRLSADDFQGTNISLTNPGGIGTVASVPRLMSGQSAIIATGSIAYPPEWAHATLRANQAARRLQGDDAHLDLRSPGHPGRRVGILPAPDRAAPSGRGRLLRERRHRPRPRCLGGNGRASGLGLRAAACSCHRPLRRHRPTGRGAPPGRRGGHLAAGELPDARAPRRTPRPARPRAEGRPLDPARDPQPDAGADGADTGLDPPHRRPRRDPAGGAAAHAGGVLRDDRLPVRASLLASAADLAARDDRDRRAPQTARRRGEEGV